MAVLLIKKPTRGRVRSWRKWDTSHSQSPLPVSSTRNICGLWNFNASDRCEMMALPPTAENIRCVFFFFFLREAYITEKSSFCFPCCIHRLHNISHSEPVLFRRFWGHEYKNSLTLNGKIMISNCGFTSQTRCIDHVRAPFALHMNETHVIQQLPLYSQFPRCNAAVWVISIRSGRVEGVGYVKSQFTLLLLTQWHTEKHSSNTQIVSQNIVLPGRHWLVP